MTCFVGLDVSQKLMAVHMVDDTGRRLWCTGWYRSVHVKSFDAHRARVLLNARAKLAGRTTRLSNHIRGLLKTFGILPGACRASANSLRP
jgi:transposase